MWCGRRVTVSSFLFWMFAGLLPVLLVGCGSGKSNWQNQVDSCSNLPQDQQATFMAPVPEAPVELLVDSSFTSAQLSGLEQAVGQWNQLGQKLQGGSFFSIQSASVPPELLTSNFSSCTVDPGTGTGALYVVNVTDSQTWKNLGFATNTPAATVRCYDGSQSLTMQVTYVNPTLVYPEQFTSVVLHEMGHMLGLGHSCESGSGSSGFASCNGLALDNPYVEAVMYPTLSLSQAQTKEQLQANDELRTACFY